MSEKKWGRKRREGKTDGVPGTIRAGEFGPERRGCEFGGDDDTSS